jgi:hypothetical protein
MGEWIKEKAEKQAYLQCAGLYEIPPLELFNGAFNLHSIILFK